MYKFDKENSSKPKQVSLETKNGPVLDSSGEGLLENIEQALNQKIKGNGIVARFFKGTIHITCWLIETDMRRRRYLRGEDNPEERRFKL